MHSHALAETRATCGTFHWNELTSQPASAKGCVPTRYPTSSSAPPGLVPKALLHIVYPLKFHCAWVHDPVTPLGSWKLYVFGGDQDVGDGQCHIRTRPPTKARPKHFPCSTPLNIVGLYRWSAAQAQVGFMTTTRPSLGLPASVVSWLSVHTTGPSISLVAFWIAWWSTPLCTSMRASSVMWDEAT